MVAPVNVRETGCSNAAEVRLRPPLAYHVIAVMESIHAPLNRPHAPRRTDAALWLKPSRAAASPTRNQGLPADGRRRYAGAMPWVFRNYIVTLVYYKFDVARSESHRGPRLYAAVVAILKQYLYFLISDHILGEGRQRSIVPFWHN